MPVVDASIALKWFVEEPDSSKAISLRDAHVYKASHLVALDLLIYEVANALLHNPRFTTDRVLQAVQTLYDLQLEVVVPTADVIQTTTQLAGRYRLTFYDALYVAVAQTVGMELITADRVLYRRVSTLPFVHLLQ